MTIQNATHEETATSWDAQQRVLDCWTGRVGRRRTARRRAKPDADLHVMPGGHAPWLHRAEQVAALTHEVLNTQ